MTDEQTRQPGWAARLHAIQAGEAMALDELSMRELILASHSGLLTELLRIQQFLGMDIDDQPAVSS